VARDFDGRRFGFRACGDDVVIYEWLPVIDPGRITVASHVIVDALERRLLAAEDERG
jgi:hypothetical protein